MATRAREVSEPLAAIAASLIERLPALCEELLEHLLEEIPELRGDEAVEGLLAASARENVATGLDVLAHGIDVERIEAPAAAAEYARRLAQRDVPLEALLRAYRLGHARFLRWWIAELEVSEVGSEEALAVVDLITLVGFRYIDTISERLIAVYVGERERWLRSASAARAGQVRALLSGGGIDLDRAEAALGYRLRGWHVGAVAWIAEPAEAGAGPARLDRVASEVAGAAGETPLVVLADETALWMWLPTKSGAPIPAEALERALEEAGAGVHVALGEPAHGVEGFRLTHRQAIQARAVAEAVGEHAARLTQFADASLIGFLAADLGAARAWVISVLGPLAADDEAAARLRETARVYLETQGSFTETGARLHLHKNTVHYRVRRAEELRGRPFTDDRLAVEVALVACERLGAAVLQPAEGEPEEASGN